MEIINEVIKKIINSGLQITKDGFEYLKNFKIEISEDVIDLMIEKIQEENIYYINEDILKSYLERASPVEEVETEVVPPVKVDVKPTVVYSLTPKPLVEVDGFVKYFRSRYKKMLELFRKRGDLEGLINTREALRAPEKTRFKIVGIVSELYIRGGRVYLDLEDEEGVITVITTDDANFRKGSMILKDQGICVDALKLREDLFIAKDIIWPDVATRINNKSDRGSFAVFISDLHVGSVHFLEDLFNDFIGWLRGRFGGDFHREVASRVRYLIIAGDIVDGVGVYPNQMRELDIRDVYEQYDYAAKLLSNIPEQIEIILIPGNHDAVSKALPQPPIPREYAEGLYADERIHVLSNPCYISLEGVEVLICHGKALDDVLSSKPGLDFHQPARGMELLLRCRHLAPTYGASTPIVPEGEDRLVIERVPDILQMGHVHIHQVRRYRGVTLIASGSWQSQTSYQRRLDIKPTPGITSIVDLKTLKTYTMDFKALGG